MSPPIRDAEFPGLPAALDVDGVLDALRAALPECRDRVALLGATVVDVRYRPGGPCWILYNVKLRHGDDRSVRQLLSGRVLRSGEAAERLPDAMLSRYAASPARALPTPVVSLPAVPMVVYGFPVDSSLPGLFDATDPEAMRSHLDVLWSDRKVRVRRVRPQVLGYTPHARAAFAYEVLSESRETRVPELRRLIGKMHAKKEPARLFADAWAVWRASRGRVNLAPPVGYLPATGITLQERVGGERLGGLIEHPNFTKWSRQTGRMLANLHQLQVPLSSRRRPEEEAQTVHRWAGVLSTVRPDLATRVDRIRDRIASEVASRARGGAPIHADFHHTNILIDGDVVTFIDLDEAAIGDPMVDVGRFLASLRIPARRMFGDIGALRDAGEEFLEAYLGKRDDDERRARLFEAAGLLIAGASAFRIQRTTWAEEVAELVGDAERVLALAGEVRVPGATPPAPARGTDARWSGDGVFMQAILAPFARDVYGAELSRCKVARGSDPESGRVEYDLSGSRKGHPWRVRLEATRRVGSGARSALKRLGAMRQASDDMPRGLRLPRPVGYVSGLSLSLCEPPQGDLLGALVEYPEALMVAEHLAEGLSQLHTAPIQLGLAPRPLDEELRRLRERLGALAAERAELWTAAVGVLAALEAASLKLAVRFAPTLRTLRPAHVVWDGRRAGLQRVDDIAVASPLHDAADFLGRCVVAGARRGGVGRWDAVADRFRATYIAVSRAEREHLVVFEAAALLRLACDRAAREGSTGLVRQLVETAQARLATGDIQA
jgi:aminoglycoside phosphotransferase (APT) family kinase protein